jgi:aspartate/methionine/tyrosine aminotransferase
MTSARQPDPAPLSSRRPSLLARFLDFKRRGLTLDMTRGKPSAAQLDLSAALLSAVSPGEHRAADGTDCRNYGILDGLPEARRLFAGVLDVGPDEIIVAGNSSLALMHDAIVQAFHRPLPGAVAPWRALPSLKFLCPSPGYDRHFAICEHLGIAMQTVEMRADGPAMDEVENLAASDPTVKGIWCVPKYSNPTGVTFSDRVVERLARMRTAAPDFRVFWDNAYAIHPLAGAADPLRNLLRAAAEAGNPDRPFVFGSTSKVTFAGAGVAMVAASAANLAFLKTGMSIQTIGPDKLNQLRHVRFFPDLAAIHAHMQKHAALLKPKFDMVHEILERELAGTGVAEWSRPRGGYFVSLDVPDGCAKRVVALAAEAGVELTAAGATFPHGRDPRDRNIRIAPSLPPLEEIRQATELLAICIQLAAIEKISAPAEARLS